MIEFPCQHCGSLLNIGIHEAGKECSCPKCGALTLVPAPQSKHARAGKTGFSIALIIPSELQRIHEIQKELGIYFREVNS